jgi:hypothetical protein
MVSFPRVLGGFLAAVVLALPSARAADLPAAPGVDSGDGAQAEVTVADYRAMSESQSRNHDRAQDISPRQLVILLEVSERTGTSLGQALATGEFESAHTWNDHIRPLLKNGNLGSAAGVWQFQPATFHSIIKMFGAQLLAATEANATTGRQHMDLGEGPFTDSEVRRLIRETVDGTRGAQDEELQLLRHNFAVLAFAKHYLTVDSGAATPEEDFLYHFLGAGQARQVLALARGDARDTLCVKPSDAAGDEFTEITNAKDPLQAFPRVAPEPALVSPLVPDVPRRGSQRRPETRREFPAVEVRQRAARTRVILQTMPPIAAEPAIFFPFAPDTPTVSSQWGLPADSPTVTGNLGMFYRDGTGQTEPYTWGEFMEHLAQRVRAENQPALVRAKYGVGFELNGGDTPERAFNPKTVSDAAAFRDENGQTVLVPEALVTGPLNRDETRQYKQRLAALVSTGEDRPADSLPPEALSALHDLGVLSANARQICPTDMQVHKALQEFRRMVGKAEPDDPSHRSRLMPAERIALEIYGQRLARYARLQARQLASSGDAVDLKRIGKMPVGLRRSAAPHLAALQSALADQDLLTRPTKKSVWRDNKRKKHVSYKTLPFAGKADKATVAALDSFQLRNGLRQTQGVLDAVTLEILGLPPLGADIFLPLSGPQSAVEPEVGAPSMYEILAGNSRSDLSAFSPIQRPTVPSVSSCILGPDLCGSAIAEADHEVSQPRKSKRKTKKRRN